MHIICTICTELITQEGLESMYITRCGHIFHLPCIMQWIARSPCCPQCREKVTKNLMIRVYPTLSEEPCHNTQIIETLLNNQHQLNAQIEKKNAKLVAMRTDLENNKKALDRYKTELANMKANMTTKLEELKRQENLAQCLQKKNDKLIYLIDNKEMKNREKDTTIKDKYRYQAKRNIEWRKAALKNHLQVYSRSINEGWRQEFKNETNSSDSLSEPESPVSDSSSSDD